MQFQALWVHSIISSHLCLLVLLSVRCTHAMPELPVLVLLLGDRSHLMVDPFRRLELNNLANILQVSGLEMSMKQSLKDKFSVNIYFS